MIRQPYEVVTDATDYKVSMILYGWPGVGKTTLALSAPEPLLIDADNGIMRVKLPHRQAFCTFGKYDELLADLTEENTTPYETIIIDTGGELFRLVKPWAIEKNSVNGQTDGTLSLKGYGAVAEELDRLSKYITRTLKKHFIVVCHAKEDDQKVRIDVDGKMKNDFWKMVDLGAFLEIKGKKRFLDFSPNENRFAKSTHGISGVFEIPEIWDVKENKPQGNNDFLSGLFSKVNLNIAEEAEAYAAQLEIYNAVIVEVKRKIESIQSTEDANGFGGFVKGLSHALTSEEEARALFRARIKELGYKWNAEAKSYVQNDGQSA